MSGSERERKSRKKVNWLEERRREQPLLSVKAHVYHIDPKSKKSWIPATQQAVPVSFFFDSSRTLYRIISVEGTKAVINSIVTPAMAVTKTSQKFLQWSDNRANMVYGLGFAKEDDLNLFLDKFREVKELSLRQNQRDDDLAHGGQTNGPPLSAAGMPAPPPMGSLARSVSPPSSASSNSSPRPPSQPPLSSSMSATPTIANAGGNIEQSQISAAQLRVENEKLREALAKSSANADKWKVQLRSLEEEKQKLLKALEESHANLARWENEVALYRGRVSELEQRRDQNGEGAADGDASTRAELERLRGLVHSLEKRNHAKDSEITNLTSRLEEFRLKESNLNQNSSEKLQTMESDNRALKLAISDMQEKLSRQVALNESLKAELRLLKSHVGRQLTDWKKIEDKLTDLLSGNPST